ncbi:MAG: hypothetical protein AAF741_11575 [Bacteroidota bacterium]
MIFRVNFKNLNLNQSSVSRTIELIKKSHDSPEVEVTPWLTGFAFDSAEISFNNQRYRTWVLQDLMDNQYQFKNVEIEFKGHKISLSQAIEEYKYHNPHYRVNSNRIISFLENRRYV